MAYIVSCTPGEVSSVNSDIGVYRLEQNDCPTSGKSLPHSRLVHAVSRYSLGHDLSRANRSPIWVPSRLVTRIVDPASTGSPLPVDAGTSTDTVVFVVEGMTISDERYRSQPNWSGIIAPQFVHTNVCDYKAK